jgi:hypothetical protein
MPSKDRKLILLRTDLLQEAIKITSKEGKTLYAFTNEIFEQALKAHQMDTTLKEVLELFMLIKLEKDGGAIAIPVGLLDAMTKKLWENGKDELLQKWFEFGGWYGQYLGIRFGGEDWLIKFGKLLKSLYGFTEFNLELNSEKACIKCVALYFTPEITECFSRFIEGVMQSAGYRSTKNRCLRGLIHIEFEKAKQKMEQAAALL